MCEATGHVAVTWSSAAGSPDGGESAKINWDITQCEATDHVDVIWPHAAGSPDEGESAQIYWDITECEVTDPGLLRPVYNVVWIMINYSKPLD